MRSFLRFGLIAISLVFVIGTFSACDEKDILKRIEKHSRSLKSLRADITMERFNAQLGESDIYKGMLIYMPDRNGNISVRLDWNLPRSESLALVDKQYVLYIPQLKQAYLGRTDVPKLPAMINDGLAFMNVSKDRLKADYEIKYLGEEKANGGVLTHHLEFTPKVKRNYKKIEFWWDHDGTPIQIKLFQLNADTTTILFTNIKKNTTVDANVFKINLPKGTKIIKN